MCEVGSWIMHDYYKARIEEIERRFGKKITKFGGDADERAMSKL